MRSCVAFVMLVAVALPALAEDAQKVQRPLADWMVERMRMQAIWERADSVRPHRRDTPLRELNITDDEVREIQDLASKYAMNTMLNISPVVTGCPCEEGPLCTDQVYVVATLPERTVGLQLSRVRKAWVVGAVQKWWIRYDALEKGASASKFVDYQQRFNQLLLEFPVCSLKEDKTDGATSAQSRATTQ